MRADGTYVFSVAKGGGRAVEKILKTALAPFMLTGFLIAALPQTAEAHVIALGCCSTVEHEHPGSCHEADGALNFSGHMYMDGKHGCIVDNSACNHENHRFWNANEKKYGNNCCGPAVVAPPPAPPPANVGNDAKMGAKSISTKPRSINVSTD